MTVPSPHDQAHCTHPDCQFEAEFGYNPAAPLGKGDPNAEQSVSVQPNDRPDVQLPVAGASGNVDMSLRLSHVDCSARIAELEGQVCRWLDAYAEVAADLTEVRGKNERLREVAKAAEDLQRFLPGPESPNIPLANLRHALAASPANDTAPADLGRRGRETGEDVMSHTFDDEKRCGQNGYVCPMCQSGVFPPDYDPCPHCQHDSSDHVTTPRSTGLNCTQLYVDVVTGEETFCDCIWIMAQPPRISDAEAARPGRT